MIQNEKYWINRSLNDAKRDWSETSDNWIKDYTLSINHPHRVLIKEAMYFIDNFASVLEVGCNSLPNLHILQGSNSAGKFAGIDINEEAIKEAKINLSDIELKVGSVLNIPFPDKTFDVILSDAVFMYIDPNQIEKAMSEIGRVAKKGLIFIEWIDDSKNGIIKDYHWARDYVHWLHKLKFDDNILIKKITKDIWPSKNWYTNGFLFAGFHQASPILEKNFFNALSIQSGIGGKIEMIR